MLRDIGWYFFTDVLRQRVDRAFHHCLILENGADTFSQNIGNELPVNTAQPLITEKISSYIEICQHIPSLVNFVYSFLLTVFFTML
jgi:hypothetical protein